MMNLLIRSWFSCVLLDCLKDFKVQNPWIESLQLLYSSLWALCMVIHFQPKNACINEEAHNRQEKYSLVYTLCY